MAPYKRTIWTPKQLRLTHSLGAKGIFSFLPSIKWRRLAFFAFPRTPCECTPNIKNSHEHVLFNCTVGDSPWPMAHALIHQYETNQSQKTSIQNEHSLWNTINNPSIPAQIKLITLCALMARWLNRWKPLNHSSHILWVEFTNQTASVELDKVLAIFDEETRQEKLQKLHNKWKIPHLFKLQHSNLQLRTNKLQPLN